jgi:hypothetical protein
LRAARYLLWCAVYFASPAGLGRALAPQEILEECVESSGEHKSVRPRSFEPERLRHSKRLDKFHSLHRAAHKDRAVVPEWSFLISTCFWSDHPVPLRAPPAVV